MTDIPNLDLFASVGLTDQHEIAMVPAGTLDTPDFKVLIDLWNERQCSDKKVILALFAEVEGKTINIGDYKMGRGIQVHDWKIPGWDPHYHCCICGKITQNFNIQDGVEMKRGDHGSAIFPGDIVATCFEHS